jgi:cytidyltransferase-like protein
MTYGVFDGFHEGHRHLLREAAFRCVRLIVVVAHPEMVAKLKGHTPQQSLEDRISAIGTFDSALTIVSGDTEPGTWSALKQYHPDVVFLGYDQHALKEASAEIGVRTIVIDSHSPDIYKSSLLNGEESRIKDGPLGILKDRP